MRYVMLKKVDFLIIYEVKNRELENACLIKLELEKRGYSVELYNTWNMDQEYLRKYPIKYDKYDAGVIISPWCYHDANVAYLLRRSPRTKKIVNMQWEQVFINAYDQDASCMWNIKGSLAREAVHISWGRKNKDKLIKVSNICENKVKLVGNVTLDFLRDEFRDYYLTREQLLKMFHIPVTKKIVLFISSFSLSGISDQLVVAPEERMLYDITMKTQTEIINWITQILNKHKEYVIVYRPHPAEAKNDMLHALKDKYDNFYMIGELSIKQWIITCDQIYIWQSTSNAEIFAAHKKCGILRPIEIPYEFESVTYQHAKLIHNQKQFEESILREGMDFPFDEQLLQSYYHIDDEPAYKKLCDVLEDVYHNNQYSLESKGKHWFLNQMKLMVIRAPFLFLPIRKTINFLYTLLGKTKAIRDDDYMNQMKKKNYSTEDEIEEVVKRIQSTFDGNP